MAKEIQDMTEPELRELMTELGRAVKDGAARQGVYSPLFVLLVFDDPGVAQYISNCRREDTIKALREAADRLEKQQDVTR